MRPRDYLQENRADMGTSGTLIYDLDYRDPITEFDLYFEATNDAAGNQENPPEISISKIELVDGGEVLWDLNGQNAFSCFVTDAEQVPYHNRTSAASDTPWQPIPIRFGRRLYDTDYAFDARKHRHPQLRITFDEATINTPGTDGYVSGSWSFTLCARLMEGAPSPKGFLTYRTVQSFNSAAGGDRRIELPTDRTIRYLMCRVYDEGEEMYSAITHYKLTADGGKWVGFDLAARDFMNRHCETFKPIWLNSYCGIANATHTQHWVGIPIWGSVMCQQPDYVMGGALGHDSQIFGRVAHREFPYAQSLPAFLIINGWAIHHTLLYAFGDRMNPTHWLDPKTFGKLDLIVTDSVATAVVDVAVQQVYRY